MTFNKPAIGYYSYTNHLKAWKFIVVNEVGLPGQIAEALSSRDIGKNGITSQAPALLVIVREKSNFVARVGGKIKYKDYPQIKVGIRVSYFS